MNRVGEIGVVEQIEEIGPELQSGTFCPDEEGLGGSQARLRT
jgi:hypothetical protein